MYLYVWRSDRLRRALAYNEHRIQLCVLQRMTSALTDLAAWHIGWLTRGAISEPEPRVPNPNNFTWMNWQKARRDSIRRYR